MTRRRATRFATGAAAVLCVLVSAPIAAAVPQNPGVVVEDGVTNRCSATPTRSASASGWTPASTATATASTDRIALDIIRPRRDRRRAQGARHHGREPVLLDGRPRQRGRAASRTPTATACSTSWPLFYDNYFVPRGYAVVLLDMAGTDNSTGCPTTGGTPDNLSAKAAIDWLNGRSPGYDKDGNRGRRRLAQRQDRA